MQQKYWNSRITRAEDFNLSCYLNNSVHFKSVTFLRRVCLHHVSKMTLTDYEREREERIARNKAILASLNIPKPFNANSKRLARAPSKAASQKRKRPASPVEEGSTTYSGESPPMKRRTSARLQQTVLLLFCEFINYSLATTNI